MSHRSSALIVLVLLQVLIRSAAAEETLLIRKEKDDPKCEDSYIFETEPDANFNQGNSAYYLELRKLEDDLRVGVIRWELPSDLKDRKITSAKVILYVQADSEAAKKNLRLGLHEVKRMWDPMVVSWNSASAEGKWEQAGARGEADISSFPITEAEATIEDGFPVEFPLPVDLVEKWVKDPATNCGLLVKFTDPGTDLSMELYSSEPPPKYSEMRPSLELTLE